MSFGRRDMLAGTVALPLLATRGGAEPMFPTPPTPLLTRIRGATITATDLAQTEAWYREGIGYAVSERGTVTPSLAASWKAPGVAGKRYILMSSPAAPDVPIRAIEQPPVPGYRAMTTWGWNAIEIIVDDVEALGRKLAGGPFTILDTPHPLNSYPSIVAMQVKGPSEEVLYLTMESGDRSKSILPPPGAPVGRTFIAVLAVGEFEAMLEWYVTNFRLTRRPKIGSAKVGIIQTAQGLGPDTTMPLTSMALAQRGNLIEFDGYPATAGARRHPLGTLPPGNALYSFGVADLGALELPYHTPPAVHAGIAYGARRAATLTGPAGELIELVEE